MSVTQKVTLYNNKFTVPPVINAVQNDTDRQVEAYFGDFTLQVGMTGKLSFIRSDGTHYEVSATLSTANNTATAELDQALTQAGVTQAQLKITDSGNVGSTFTFMIKVQPDVAGISQQQDGYSAEELAQGIADNASAIASIENVELPKKADSDGYYEQLGAGTAEQLMSKKGLTDLTPYTYRAIPHDSTREVMRKIVGGTLAWNQMVKNGDFSNGTTDWIISQYLTTTVADKVMTTVCTSSGDRYNVQNISFTVGHKYFLAFDGYSDSSNYQNNSIAVVYFGAASNYKDFRVSSASTWQSFSAMFECVSNTYNVIRLRNAVQGDTNKFRNVRIIDLTAMLGSTIADYVYSLETATAGAGVAWLKSHFPKAFSTYQPYDAGSLKSVEGLVSHDTVGFNQFAVAPKYASSASDLVYANAVRVMPNSQYQFTFTGISGATSWRIGAKLYDLDWNVITDPIFTTSRTLSYYSTNQWFMQASNGITKDLNITFSRDCKVLFFFALGDASSSSVIQNACLHLSRDGSRDGQYEPYQKHSYPLDPTQELRGIFKLDASNNLYADGDEWYADGRKNVRYGIVDLGTLNWTYVSASAWNCFSVSITGKATGINFICGRYVRGDVYNTENDKCIDGNSNNSTIYIRDTSFNNDAAAFKTAMSGVYLVYELATPTESTAPSFADTQIIDPDGTEEFVTECIVAVGNETFYANDLVGKLDDLPALPTTAGTYRLKVTVTAGVPSYEWIAT